MTAKSVLFKEELSKHIFNMTPAVFWRTVSLGVFAGIATWLLSLALDRYILTPYFCNGTENIATCTNSIVISGNIAMVLVGVMVVPLLAMFYNRRSLLIVITAIASLWGLAAWVAGEWYWSLAWTAVAYGFVFMALAWINRLRSNVVAVILMLVFVVIARLVLTL